MGKFFAWIAGQLADGLEKSTVGAISMFAVIACIVYLVIVEGGTATVDSLLTTAMIVSATLMGVNSVTEIFKKSDNRTLNINETITKNIKEENVTNRQESYKEEHNDCDCDDKSNNNNNNNNNNNQSNNSNNWRH